MPATHMTYGVRFLCPAFLGNAEQSGQWRTPPFKALLRQWWRVAYAADHNFAVKVDEMRAAEGRLFGTAADTSGSTKSQVQFRLEAWRSGSLRNWPALATVRHPEVARPVGSDLYLGYGPLTFEAGRTTLKKGKTAINGGEHARLQIVVAPEVGKSEVERVVNAINLINLYGTIGGRSRNGWGSFVLEPLNGTPVIPAAPDTKFLRLWHDALDRDWPHAVGRDERGPLVWQTRMSADWKQIIKELAEIKIALRTHFPFPARNHPEPLPRHWLSYPITKHGTARWDRNARLPNSLRFKLRLGAHSPEKLRGIIFHVPCMPPPEFRPNRESIVSVWQKVHAFLDKPEQKLSRIPA